MAKAHPSPPSPCSVKEINGAIVIPRPVTKTDQLRLIIAVLTTAAAIGFTIAGFLWPSWVGIHPGLFVVAGPALVIAAVVHLMLVSSGIRRPLATFTKEHVQIQGWTFQRSQIIRLWIQRDVYQASPLPTLMIGTTRDGLETLPVLPPGLLSDADLNELFLKTRKLLDL